MSDTRTEELYATIEGALDDSREHESGLAIDALDALTSRLEALEGEHEAVREIRWRESLRKMPPIDPDYSSDIDRLFRTFDHAERVMQREHPA